MQTVSDTPRLVLLRGGLCVPFEPLSLLLTLEAAGFSLSRDGRDILVQPFSKLTDDDKRQLKLWKRHVLALLDYEAPEVEAVQ
jgi:hypothetical protein